MTHLEKSALKEDKRPACWLSFHRCEAIAIISGERCKMPADGKKYCGFHDGSDTPPPYDKDHQDRLRKKWIQWCKHYEGNFPDELRGLTCGARTRKGTPCKQRGLYASGRCRLHGGLSTGPRTPEGKIKSSLNGKKRSSERSP